ncbi:hypothetical protein Ciccas_012505 [Cichlidogyrus casuarinus]|uniref:Uncharacterized protein n=1 Tax=Cichlidogyrus casuarinus TaxID=1844966 RepID=A0ABD2PN75_9PLAT
MKKGISYLGGFLSDQNSIPLKMQNRSKQDKELPTDVTTVCAHYRKKRIIAWKRRRQMRCVGCFLGRRNKHGEEEDENWHDTIFRNRAPPPPPQYAAPSKSTLLKHAYKYEKDDVMESETVVGLTLLKYIRRTTLHCLAHLAHARSIRGRIFWFLILVTAMLGFLGNLYRIMVNYWQGPILTNIYHDSKVFRFPDISFCNLNPLFFPPSNTSENLELAKNIREFATSYKEKRTSLSLVRNFMTEKIIFGHPAWSFVVDCEFQSETCNETHFITTYTSPYGQCHTFNPDAHNKTRQLDIELTMRGLRPHFEVSMFIVFL